MNPLESLASFFGGLFGPRDQAQAAPKKDLAQAIQEMQGNGWSLADPSASPAMQIPTPQAPQQTAAPQIPAPTMQPQQMMPSPTMPPTDVLRHGIANTYGADNPLLSHLDTYLQAAQQMPQGADPMLPIILALRETQGGRDLLNPANMKGPNDGLGDNNVYNIRNDQSKFQNYPDLATAILGNLQQGGESGGVVGLLNGSKPSSKYIYEDWRQNPQDLSKLFSHWSPHSDGNGSLDEQVNNYQWIRDHITQNAN